MKVREPELWYVTPGQPITIGYAARPDATLTIMQLNLETEPPVEVICTTESTGSDGPYWLIATFRGPGTVWFEWMPPGAPEPRKILIHADNDDDTAVSRTEDAARMRRRQIIWRLMHVTRCAEEIVDRVCQRVGNDPTLAMHAFAVAAHVLGGSSIERARARLVRLKQHQGREVNKILAALNITVHAEVIPTILDGALLVLGR